MSEETKLFDGLITFPVTLEVRGLSKSCIEELRELTEGIIARELGTESFSVFLLSDGNASERSREPFRTLVKLRSFRALPERRFGFK